MYYPVEQHYSPYHLTSIVYCIPVFCPKEIKHPKFNDLAKKNRNNSQFESWFPNCQVSPVDPPSTSRVTRPLSTIRMPSLRYWRRLHRDSPRLVSKHPRLSVVMCNVDSPPLRRVFLSFYTVHVRLQNIFVYDYTTYWYVLYAYIIGGAGCQLSVSISSMTTVNA